MEKLTPVLAILAIGVVLFARAVLVRRLVRTRRSDKERTRPHG